MNSSRSSLASLSALAVVAIAGCSGFGSQSRFDPGSTQPSAVQRVANLRPSGGNPSWISAEAKTTKLVYIDDGDGQVGGDSVDIYSYRTGKLLGQLTGLDKATSLCSDAAGNVFVVNTGKQDILEYAHGGTTPIATLNDAGWNPWSCAVDPTTGNLAVTNLQETNQAGQGDGPGSVAVYKRAQGTPKIHALSELLTDYEWCAYDDHGNLFVDGQGGNGFVLAELQKNGNFFGVLLNQAFSVPTNIDPDVRWDGSHITIVNPGSTGTAPISSVLYRVAIRGVTGTVVSSTTLNSAYGVYQYYIDSKNVVVLSGSESGGGPQNIMSYNYPAVGSAVKNFPVRPTFTFGMTVSQ